MKKYGLVLGVALIVMGGCASAPVVYTMPYQASVAFPAAGEYEILGRVSVVLPMDTAGYGLFLEAARNQYPLTDDVVNILVDREDVYDGNGEEPTLLSSSFRMTGMAIRYLADFPREPVAATPAMSGAPENQEATQQLVAPEPESEPVITESEALPETPAE